VLHPQLLPMHSTLLMTVTARSLLLGQAGHCRRVHRFQDFGLVEHHLPLQLLGSTR
jgi:hypothetical protein